MISHKKEVNNWIIFDLDGVLIRWPQYHLPNAQELAEMLVTLNKIVNGGYRIAVLTNRPASQMQALAYLIGVNYGYWITESGGSVYDVTHHKCYTTQKWIGAAKKTVPKLRELIVKSGIVDENSESNEKAYFEPGMSSVKTIICERNLRLLNKAYQKISNLIKSSKFQNNFVIKVGKAIEIDPVGLSKEDGMRELLKLNKINTTKNKVIFIADNKRDIPGAKYLISRGGIVAAVGNSDEEYMQFVKNEKNAIVAPPNTSYHSSVTYILNFLLETQQTKTP